MTALELYAFVILPVGIAAAGLAIAFGYRRHLDGKHRKHPAE